ncbi:MAG TPA: tetratricopeptide repeat protein [Candidatus Angelobacter sp.]|jgi:tetratricopeptide (TPR) repeat protein|nr:tetratricopeptide repeat protein [Candidatus Angelobacter sp.]
MRSRILSVPLLLVLSLIFSCPLFLAQQNTQTTDIQADAKAQKSGSDSLVPHDSPSSPAAQEALAKGQELMFKQHDVKASIEHFKKVVELDPAFLQGHILLGNAYMQTGQWTEAQSTFEKAAKLEPLSSVALLGIGAALNQQLDYAGAQEPLRQSLELNRASAEAHYELARALWGLNKWEEAEPHVRKAIQLNKDYATPHLLMGNIYLQEENPAFAMAEFQEYLNLAPQGPDAPAVKEMVAKIQKALGTPGVKKRSKAAPKNHFLPLMNADWR